MLPECRPAEIKASWGCGHLARSDAVNPRPPFDLVPFGLLLMPSGVGAVVHLSYNIETGEIAGLR
jgi:hypothetical protein